VLLTLAVLVIAPAMFRWAMGRPQFWRFQIRAYQRADQSVFPPPGVIVFTGSSSIFLWKTLQEDMQPLHVINRGFGGSQIAQVSYYARTIVTPYRPRAVVLYAGENDLSRKSPQTVLEDFEQLVGLIRAELPDTWLYFISIKPTPWGNWPRRHLTNQMIEEYVRTQERMQFIDVSTAMLDSGGRLRRELYSRDPIHMNAGGYALWTSIIRPVLLDRFGSDGAPPRAQLSQGS
jgi:lysophospholipase L1-like esterase